MQSNSHHKRFSSFVAMTVDVDDVAYAHSLLAHTRQTDADEKIAQFEQAFAQSNGSRYAYSFMGGRVALSALINSLQLTSGDEAIISGYTCVVVRNAFIYAHIPITYCDIELDTYGLDINDLEKKITPRTKVIVLQHLYGLVCRDYEKIIALAHSHNIFVIEDCAHATGALYKNKKVGNLGDAAFYTFEHSKVISTFMGGMCTTNNEHLAKRISTYQQSLPFPSEERIQQLVCNFIYDYYANKSTHWLVNNIQYYRYKNILLKSTTAQEIQGIKPEHYAQKMPSALAAIGLRQISKLDHYNKKRRENARQWDAWCDENNYAKPLIVPNSEPIFLRYPVMVKEIMKQKPNWAKKICSIPAGVWFISNMHPVNDTPFSDCPNANKAIKKCINLPTLAIEDAYAEV